MMERPKRERAIINGRVSNPYIRRHYYVIEAFVSGLVSQSSTRVLFHLVLRMRANLKR